MQHVRAHVPDFGAALREPIVHTVSKNEPCTKIWTTAAPVALNAGATARFATGRMDPPLARHSPQYANFQATGCILGEVIVMLW